MRKAAHRMGDVSARSAEGCGDRRETAAAAAVIGLPFLPWCRCALLAPACAGEREARASVDTLTKSPRQKIMKEHWVVSSRIKDQGLRRRAILLDRLIQVDARPGHADEPVGEPLRLGARDRSPLRRPLQEGAHLSLQAPPVPHRAAAGAPWLPRTIDERPDWPSHAPVGCGLVMSTAIEPYFKALPSRAGDVLAAPPAPC